MGLSSASDYTGSEIASIIAWRYERNNQSKWVTRRLVEEFNVTDSTVKEIFRNLSQVIDVDRRSEISPYPGMGFYRYEVHVLNGMPETQGKELSTKAGAFLLSWHLARYRWAENSTLAKLVGWTRKRTRQLTLYRLRHLPLYKYTRQNGAGSEILWVVMN